VNINEDKIIEWRRHFHKNPELSFHEQETTDYIVGILNSLEGIVIERPGPTGIIARLKGSGPGPVIALRGDMDALPISEENTTEYASVNSGVMHACGHDAHTAMLLGACVKLHEMRSEWSGEIRFIFQHAEEFIPGGAIELIKAGALNGVSAILGAHVNPDIESGKIGLIPGAIMAAPDEFSITITGKGGHAALPQRTIDPVIIGSQLVCNLQSIVSRTVDPLESAVLSVTQFHGGRANNVIPSSAVISGTVRTFKSEIQNRIKEKIGKIATALAEAHDAVCEYHYIEGYPAVINDIEITTMMTKAVEEELGEAAVYEAQPLMAGEDFGRYLQLIPGCFYFVGVTGGENGLAYPLHHPRFDIDETALSGGVRVMVKGALGLLELEKEKI
jgi:amidohydrolase